ncbi:hypothetical protein CYMTET_39430 [Cymbomonas tetramitiformis]|uniref:Uncharacterized protein n=1 Tax=Cymbomonas tetramitiformis TaxID=36881 RepID=A0AAE0CBA2_9CHLO|nr:hypothetical protein CYMTET_39433 [Cymbomonas tetramitiformis]KAK3251223.1 hypothetical protein CYMTET_39430 [Cymbomonas tetramitiformis]
MWRCSIERVEKARKLRIRSHLSDNIAIMLVDGYVNMRLLEKDCNPAVVSVIEYPIVDDDENEMPATIHPDGDPEELADGIQEDADALLRNTVS